VSAEARRGELNGSSKFYGIRPAGRPTIYIGDVTGEIPTILSDADCGSSIAVGDVDGLSNASLGCDISDCWSAGPQCARGAPAPIRSQLAIDRGAPCSIASYAFGYRVSSIAKVER